MIFFEQCFCCILPSGARSEMPENFVYLFLLRPFAKVYAKTDFDHI